MATTAPALLALDFASLLPPLPPPLLLAVVGAVVPPVLVEGGFSVS